MEITKREIIISIAIAAVMLIIGFFISGKITDFQNDKNAEYQKAVHIEDSELFRYGMYTNVGNAFVYGDLQAVDTVTFDEIGGEYMYVKKVEEHYNRHTRTVTKTRTVNGRKQTYTDTEIYYSWDYHDSWERKSDKIKFCGMKFGSDKIDFPDGEYIKTLGDGLFSRIRFKYYGTPVKHIGTIYTRLKDGTIADNSRFFKDYTIEQALDSCTSGIGNMMFWVLWIALTAGAVIGFCYLNNRWLED